tara:strand:- start:157 stop:411 length:255 start_codon:yes stop_codon:yes gene_type:complete
MIIPVRCFTCGKVVGHMEKRYNELKDAGMPIPAIYQELGLRRICCKRMLFLNVNAGDKMAEYTVLPENVERTPNRDGLRIVKAR